MNCPVGGSAGGQEGLTIAELLAGGGFNDNSGDWTGSDVDSVITDDGSAFSTMSLDEANVHCMENTPDEVFHDPPQQNLSINAAENEVGIGPYPPNHGSTAVGRIDDDISTRKVPKNRSIAHFHLHNQLCSFVSFDIETGGENCGIIQISAEICRMTH